MESRQETSSAATLRACLIRPFSGMAESYRRVASTRFLPWRRAYFRGMADGLDCASDLVSGYCELFNQDEQGD